MGACRITDGTFGEAEYFQDLVDNVNDMTKSNDWFLVANDFASYMEAQKEVDQVSTMGVYLTHESEFESASVSRVVLSAFSAHAIWALNTSEPICSRVCFGCL